MISFDSFLRKLGIAFLSLPPILEIDYFFSSSFSEGFV